MLSIKEVSQSVVVDGRAIDAYQQTGLGGDIGNWVYIIPTVATQGGSLNSYNVSARYLIQKHKVVFVTVYLDIINAGTGTGWVSVTFPTNLPLIDATSTPASQPIVAVSGYESLSLKALSAYISTMATTPPSNVMFINLYDGSSVCALGQTSNKITGFYGIT